LITGVEQVYQEIEESSGNLNNLLVNKYLGRLRNRVDGLLKTVNRVNELVEKWVEI